LLSIKINHQNKILNLLLKPKSCRHFSLLISKIATNVGLYVISLTPDVFFTQSSKFLILLKVLAATRVYISVL
jgi:hypothetical protein